MTQEECCSRVLQQCVAATCCRSVLRQCVAAIIRYVEDIEVVTSHDQSSVLQ